MVWKGVYRSGYPTKKHFSFLGRLGLRSVLFLCPEEYPESHLAFYAQQGIQLLQFGVVGNKQPFDHIPESVLRAALHAVLDPVNQPLLIHCNQGKHRTGCLVGCLRKTQRWSLVTIFEEYRRFAGIKARIDDQHFIERFSFECAAATAHPTRPARLGCPCTHAWSARSIRRPNARVPSRGQASRAGDGRVRRRRCGR